MDSAAPETPSLSPRRTRRREARRRLMCDTAAAIVRSEGLDALTIARLANDLDCAVGSIYTYFPSKDALVAEVTAQATETLADAYEATRPAWTSRLARRRNVSPETAAVVELLAFVEFFAAAADTLAEEFSLLRLSLTDPRPIVADGELDRAFAPGLRLAVIGAHLIDDAASAGALHAGDTMVRLFVWAASTVNLLGLAKLSRYGPAAGDPARLARTLTTDLLTGWGVESETLAAAERHMVSLREADVFVPNLDREETT